MSKCFLLLFLYPAVAMAAAPPAAPRPSNDQIHHWIEMLGDKDFFVRQKAEQELSKAGFDAIDMTVEQPEVGSNETPRAR